LFAIIDDEFEERAWSYELTSFWSAAGTVGIPASLRFRSCASRSQTGASQSRQSTDCHKFDSWKNLTSHLPRACLMLVLAGFPSSLLLFHLSRSFTHFYRLSHSELVDIEKVAVCSSLRLPKSKRTIESRDKRSSKVISLGHYSILLASSYTVKSKAYFKCPTHYPCG
nr:hypothetical protein [Tanacetum cinerariifolium]